MTVIVFVVKMVPSDTSAHLMVAVPAATACSTPVELLMVALSVSSEDQVTASPAGLVVAVRVTSSPPTVMLSSPLIVMVLVATTGTYTVLSAN